MESSLRTLRIVRLFVLASIVTYAYIANHYGPAPKPSQPLVLYMIAGLAVSIVATIFVMRHRIILRQEAALAANPEDRPALSRWCKGYVMIYALCEAVALYGFVLQYMGFTFSQVAAFYLAGVFLMLFFAPKQPSSATG